FDRAGRARALAGGGRYDDLISNLSDGGISLPALGFAMGDVVLGDLIDETPAARDKMQRSVAAARAIDIFVVIAKEDRRADAIRIVQQLRDGGHCVDYSLAQAKVGKQFQSAEQLGARTAILFGDEWPQVAVKNLESGEQELMPHDVLLKRLSS
ncbi:MAG: His/Gly/Thr/Pro-type tRNA ligase C-terminal domain-containing protein, partial [Chthoniobacterales bacterium]